MTAVYICLLPQEKQPTVTSAERPPLIYDYHGFPEESYSIRYDAPGSPQLAQRIQDLLHSAGLPCALKPERGWDHGVFVPLKLLYPAADIPVVALSMLSSLSAEVLSKLITSICSTSRSSSSRIHRCTQLHHLDYDVFRYIRLFLERNAAQMSGVARYIHLCFQARMSDESRLAPHPRL